MKWTHLFLIILTLICCTHYIHHDMKDIRDDIKKETDKSDKLYNDLSDTLRYRIK